ncbi:MAG TPA: hypothetical protein VIJ95_09030 [Hanamia sp.]
MKTETELIVETENFFMLYWKDTFGQTPHWSKRWDFKNSILNHEKKGCYALINKENEIIYIGVAIGKNFGKYKQIKGNYGGGLGARLKAYWQVDKRPEKENKYTPSSKWEEKGMKDIRTIGFEDEHYCLAAALEIFLIDKLKPIRNSKHAIKNIDA